MSLLQTLLDEKRSSLPGGLYHSTQIKLCYNSNRIEGSNLSEEQTRYIFETNTLDIPQGKVADVDDIVETANHFSAFDYILEHGAEPLSEELIKELHRILKSSTSDARKDWFAVGDYKKKPNQVGGLETTKPTEVSAKIAELIESYNAKSEVTFDDIIDFHYRFERIHPFQDGNGRVGRLILFKECLKHDVMPFIIDDQKKLFYYRGLSEYEREKGFLLDTCRSAQDSYEKLVAYFEQDSDQAPTLIM